VLKVRNSTGGTLWWGYPDTVRTVGRSILQSGQEATLATHDEAASQVQLFLEGLWEPPVLAAVQTGFKSRTVLSTVTGPGYFKNKEKTVELVCEVIDTGAEMAAARKWGRSGSIASASTIADALYRDRELGGSSASAGPGITAEQLAQLEEAPARELTLDVHSAVRIVNNTQDSVEAFEDTVQPGGSLWLPVMVVSTGAVQLRPSSAYSWGHPIRFNSKLPAATSASSAPAGEPDDVLPFNRAVGSPDGASDFTAYAAAECVHLQTEQACCYAIKVTRSAATGITEISVHAPVTFENMLPCPVIISVARAALPTVRFFFDPHAKDGESQGPYDPSDPSDPSNPDHKGRITQHVERHEVGERCLWNLYSGRAFDPARVTISLVDSTHCRVKGLIAVGSLELADPSGIDGQRGFEASDPSSEFRLRFVSRDLCAGAPLGQIARHIRLFSDYVFLDRTRIALRFSEDSASFATSHPQDTSAAGLAASAVTELAQTELGELARGDDTGLLALVETKVPYTKQRVNGDPLDKSFAITLSTAGCRRWSKPLELSALLAASEPDQDPHSSPVAQVVRVPVALQFCPMFTAFNGDPALLSGPDSADNGDPPGPLDPAELRANARIRSNFVFEVVACASKQHSSADLDEPAAHFSLSGPEPSLVAYNPRLLIVNNLGCAVAMKLATRTKSETLEMPIVVPSGSSSPFVFSTHSSSDDSPDAALSLSSLQFLPIFVPQDSSSDPSVWEWGSPIAIDRPREFVVGFHTLNLDRRLIARVQVRVEASGPASQWIVVLQNQDPLTVPVKVQNQTSRCSLRFAQRVAGEHVPFWQTIHAQGGVQSLPFAFEDHTLSFPPGVQLGLDGVRAVQRPLVLIVRVHACGETIECDVDVATARVGTRRQIRLPGSQPDVILQTRTEPSTGALVVVVSDFKQSGQGPRALLRSEEERFASALWSQSHPSIADLPAVSNLFPPLHLLHKAQAEQSLSAAKGKRHRRRRAAVGVLQLGLKALKGVEFQPQSSVVFVVSFAKSTRRIVVDAAHALRGELPTELFYFNQFHDPTDPDFDSAAIDVYERHDVTGTQLKVTATLGDVQELVDQAQREQEAGGRAAVTIAVTCYSAEPRTLGAPYSESLLVCELSVPPIGSTDTRGLPGTQRLRVDFEAPRVKINLSDAEVEDIQGRIRKRDGIDAAKALSLLRFASVMLRDVCFVYGASSSHNSIGCVASALRLVETSERPPTQKVASKSGTDDDSGSDTDWDPEAQMAITKEKKGRARLQYSLHKRWVLNAESAPSGPPVFDLHLLAREQLLPMDPADEASPLAAVTEHIRLSLSNPRIKTDHEVTQRIGRLMDSVRYGSASRAPSSAVPLLIRSVEINPIQLCLSSATTAPSPPPLNTREAMQQTARKAKDSLFRSLVSIARTPPAELERQRRERAESESKELVERREAARRAALLAADRASMTLSAEGVSAPLQILARDRRHASSAAEAIGVVAARLAAAVKQSEKLRNFLPANVRPPKQRS